MLMESLLRIDLGVQDIAAALESDFENELDLGIGSSGGPKTAHAVAPARSLSLPMLRFHTRIEPSLLPVATSGTVMYCRTGSDFATLRSPFALLCCRAAPPSPVGKPSPPRRRRPRRRSSTRSPWSSEVSSPRPFDKSPCDGKLLAMDRGRPMHVTGAFMVRSRHCPWRVRVAHSTSRVLFVYAPMVILACCV